MHVSATVDCRHWEAYKRISHGHITAGWPGGESSVCLPSLRFCRTAPEHSLRAAISKSVPCWTLMKSNLHVQAGPRQDTGMCSQSRLQLAGFQDTTLCRAYIYYMGWQIPKEESASLPTDIAVLKPCVDGIVHQDQTGGALLLGRFLVTRPQIDQQSPPCGSQVSATCPATKEVALS